MHEYEIRILRADGRSSLITSQIHLNDYAAIRSALKLANGKRVEVWHGLERVYSSSAMPPPLRVPDHPAA
jgi:hypothetical protein